MRKLRFSWVAIFAFSVTGCVSSQQQALNNYVLSEVQKDISEGLPLSISGFGVDDINSVGGVEIMAAAINLSPKTIKYLTYDFTPYNSVGDVQRGEIRRRSKASVYTTGPYAQYEPIVSYWENVWYNSDIKCIVLSRVEIEYMDGTSVTFGSSQVQNILIPSVRNNCRV